MININAKPLAGYRDSRRSIALCNHTRQIDTLDCGFVPNVEVASLEVGHWFQQEKPQETTDLMWSSSCGQPEQKDPLDD